MNLERFQFIIAAQNFAVWGCGHASFHANYVKIYRRNADSPCPTVKGAKKEYSHRRLVWLKHLLANNTLFDDWTLVRMS